jgi:hypothetical protein
MFMTGIVAYLRTKQQQAGLVLAVFYLENYIFSDP